MSRLLVIPAAGLGSRLGAALPKLLVPVAGVPMIDRILELYRHAVGRVVVIVSPTFAADVRRHFDLLARDVPIECIEQPAPTGMLDAILLALPAARGRDLSSVWVTWCDQVAVHPRTIARLAEHTAAGTPPALVMPTVTREHPYIHFERDPSGRISRVLHRREGDRLPATGESDMGVFAMSPAAYRELLPEYSREVETGHATGERNFLPFVPWLARTHDVVTFPCEHPMEALGVNTPEDLRLVEQYLSPEPEP